MKTVRIKAEPLNSETYEPFGQVIGLDDVHLHLRQDEQFRMGIIHMPNRGYRVCRLNHHRHSTQALIPLEGKAYIIVVAPPDVTFEFGTANIRPEPKQ